MGIDFTSARFHEIIERDGFVIIPSVLPQESIDQLSKSLSKVISNSKAVRVRNERVYALRNLMSLAPDGRNLAESKPIKPLVDALMKSNALCVRAILFDKNAEMNWKVAWHQDLAIAVKQRRDAPGFGPWSIKAGVQHVQPPVEVLQKMLIVRLHLDDCGAGNGPLSVIPESHAAGILSPAEIRSWRIKREPLACHIARGGALLMRPLLLHSSSSATSNRPRRVIHLEYSAAKLASGLEWHEQ